MESLRGINKILIVGDAGRGKTTLAHRLSEALTIQKHSTDDYFYEIKYSKPRDKNEAIARISELYTHDRWIVEGTTQWLWRPGLESADVILFLTHRSVFAQWWILIKRYFGRRNEETILELLRLMKHVLYKRYGLGYRKGKETHAQIIAPYSHKIVRLRSFKEINAFIESICA